MKPTLPATSVHSEFGELHWVVAETQAGRVIGGTRAEFGSFLQSEHDRWSKVIRAGGFEPRVKRFMIAGSVWRRPRFQ